MARAVKRKATDEGGGNGDEAAKKLEAEAATRRAKKAGARKPKPETDAEKIARLEDENAKLRALVQRTAAFLGREGAKLGTAGADLNRVFGL